MKDFEVPDLGPLPLVDHNDTLQRESLDVFRSVLPKDKFLFRDERIDDKGVDGSIELLVKSQATNFRAQIQLKSTDSSAINLDGSISVSVDVSNLNHLLNNNIALYVLYIKPRNELRFAWARDERRRIERAKPEWLEQGSVTIRFDMPITPETLKEIHQRIIQETRLQRKFNDIRDKASSAERIVVSINPETLDITDPEEAKRLLIKSGTVFVSAGYAQQVKSLIRVLNPKDAQEPRILLVQAHAETHLGRYKQAILYIDEASLRSAELSDEDRLFLQALQDSCDFQLGRISMSEFSQRLEQTSQGDNGPFAFSGRLQKIRYALHSNEERPHRVVLLEELRKLVEEIVGTPDVSSALKMHARICLLESDGYQILLDTTQEIGETLLQLGIGNIPDFAAMFQLQAARVMKWEEEAATLLKNAVDSGHSFQIADLMTMTGGICYGVLTNQKIFSLQYKLPISFPEKIIQSNVERGQQAAEIFSQIGNLEAELRAKMLVADFYDLIGRQDDAKEIAAEVVRKAKVMGYSDLIKRAEKQLSGQTLQNLAVEAFRPKSEKEKAVDDAQESDELLRRNAAQMLRLLNLPADRQSVMERYYFSRRDIAREKSNWCRHINLMQDSQHTLHPETHFRTDQIRFCVCQLHQCRSKLGDRDWATVIFAFKKSYCEECKDKSPYSELLES